MLSLSYFCRNTQPVLTLQSLASSVMSSPVYETAKTECEMRASLSMISVIISLSYRTANVWGRSSQSCVRNNTAIYANLQMFKKKTKFYKQGWCDNSRVKLPVPAFSRVVQMSIKANWGEVKWEGSSLISMFQVFFRLPVNILSIYIVSDNL